MEQQDNLHRASFQERIPDDQAFNTVKCSLCPHNCTIMDGKTGVCRCRINRNGVLYTLTYGKPCSISVDPIEKKPLFHFFPGKEIFSLSTVGCNFHCLNCQNWSISQASPLESEHYELTPEEIVNQAQRHNTDCIAFTYTEPTVFYEYMYDIAAIAHEQGLKTVMVSNGYINPDPLLALCPNLDAANIDLKCFDDVIYRKLTGGGLQPVLDTLKLLKENGVWLEITNLVIPSWTEARHMIESMCEWLVGNGFSDTPLHFSRFFPNYKLSKLQPTSAINLIMAKEIAENAGLKYVYIGNIPMLHGENTVCPNCRKTLVVREGYLVRENNIEVSDKSRCRFCKEPVAGVF